MKIKSMSDPGKILDLARTYYNNEDYEKALQAHIWFFKNALKHEVSYAGVRLSFALTDWIKLGKVYPKAIKELKQIKNEKINRIKKIPSFSLFHDIHGINGKFCLNKVEETIQLFIYFHKNNPELAKKMFLVIENDLMDNKYYLICSKYLDNIARIVENQQQSLRSNIRIMNDYPRPSHLKFTLQSYKKGINNIFLLLYETKRYDEIKEALHLTFKNIDYKEINEAMKVFKEELQTKYRDYL